MGVLVFILLGALVVLLLQPMGNAPPSLALVSTVASLPALFGLISLAGWRLSRSHWLSFTAALFCLAGWHSLSSMGGGGAYYLMLGAAGFLLLAATDWMPEGTQTQAYAGAPGGAGTPEPSPEQAYKAEPSDRTFADLAGMAELKAELLEAAGEIVAPHSRGGTAARPSNGILLHGEPGNGKTMVAEALAGEIGLPIISVSFGQTVSRWVNASTEQMMTVFAAAKAQAPCVLFLDEIDAVLPERGKIANADSEMARMVPALLKAVVDLRASRVVLIAATNHLDRLDGAGVREGRFDYKIEVPPPDPAAREAILTHSLERHGAAGRYDALDVREVVGRWEGFSAARIHRVGEVVGKRIRRGEIARVSVSDIKAALRQAQGSKGQRLREDVPTLDQLELSATMRRTLDGLARRMQHTESAERLGAKLPQGVLFHGPPGTGKTHVAQSLAKTAGWAFIKTTGQELMASAEAVKHLLDRARNLRPVVVFIDEGDDVLGDRASQPWAKSSTSSLLDAIDGAGGSNRDVLFIAATNLPESIDAAARRGGRFSKKIAFPLPDAPLIANVVRKWMMRVKPRLDPVLTPDYIAAALAPAGYGDVVAVLDEMVNAMYDRSTHPESETITVADFNTAREATQLRAAA